MANRRMFNLKIVDTDSFLEMPTSTRLLYYDLAMRADDDGFVNSPQKIMKIVGATIDDFKILCAKQYIFPFESGICVIKDWKIHNYIQKDRYQETMYKDEFSQLSLDENDSYIKCIQDVSKMDTQVRVRLGKDIDKKKIIKEKKDAENLKNFEELWSIYPKRQGGSNKQESFRQYLKRLAEGYTHEQIKQGIENYKKAHLKQIGTEFIKTMESFLGKRRHFLTNFTEGQSYLEELRDKFLKFQELVYQEKSDDEINEWCIANNFNPTEYDNMMRDRRF